MLLVACNTQGKATRPFEQDCIPQGERCGDGVCEGCEVCNTCFDDCCPNKCFDTDGGQNPIQSGKISGMYKGESFEHLDYCMGTTSVLEYFCGAKTYDVPSNIRIKCEKGCKDSACLE